MLNTIKNLGLRALATADRIRYLYVNHSKVLGRSECGGYRSFLKLPFYEYNILWHHPFPSSIGQISQGDKPGRHDGGLAHTDSSGSGKKWSHPGYILKVQLTRVANGLEVMSRIIPRLLV